MTIRIIIVLAAIVIIYLFWFRRPTPVNWYTHNLENLTIETPNTNQVRFGLSRDWREDLKIAIPFRMISFDGEWGGWGTGPNNYKQRLKIFLFPDPKDSQAPLEYLQGNTKNYQAHLSGEPFKETWEGIISKLVVFDYSLDPSFFNLLEDHPDIQIYYYERRYDQTAFFILSKTQPYIVALQFNGLGKEEEYERLKRIHASLKINWEKVRELSIESTDPRQVTVVGKPTVINHPVTGNYRQFVTTNDNEQYFFDDERNLKVHVESGDEVVVSGYLDERIVYSDNSETKIKFLESATYKKKE